VTLPVGLLVNGEHLLVETLGSQEIPLLFQQLCQGRDCHGGVGMVRAKPLLTYGKALLVVIPGGGKIPLLLYLVAKIVQGRCRVWVLWTEDLFVDGQRLFRMAAGLRVFSLA
jgi:hypothetical protein